MQLQVSLYRRSEGVRLVDFTSNGGKVVGLRGNYYSDGGVDAITASDMTVWTLKVQSCPRKITSSCEGVERR